MLEQILYVCPIYIYDKDRGKIESEWLIVFSCILCNLCKGFLIRIQEESSGIEEVRSFKASLVA